MQTSQPTRADEQAPEDASAAVADPKPARRGRPPGSTNKKASKKKASKKKASKKKASKKKAGKKKAGKKKVSKKTVSKKTASKKATKKKASKKKRSKKTAAQAAPASGRLARIIAAVEELREAVLELAKSSATEHQQAVVDLRALARRKIDDLENAATRTLDKFK